MRSRSSSLLIAAALGMASAVSPLMQNKTPAITQTVSKRQMLRNARGPMLYAGQVTSRRTVAQDKREALKRRNRMRNKGRTSQSKG
ncbi:MAG: hypothetical protein CML17_06355 [Pusillimonas sp.]|nr:hypothetical protein [Pusillimonas sp.]